MRSSFMHHVEKLDGTRKVQAESFYNTDKFQS